MHGRESDHFKSLAAGAARGSHDLRQHVVVAQLDTQGRCQAFKPMALRAVREVAPRALYGLMGPSGLPVAGRPVDPEAPRDINAEEHAVDLDRAGGGRARGHDDQAMAVGWRTQESDALQAFGSDGAGGRQKCQQKDQTRVCGQRSAPAIAVKFFRQAIDSRPFLTAKDSSEREEPLPGRNEPEGKLGLNEG